jgi:hypothetical protein
MFWVVAFLLFCVMVGYVLYALQYLVRIADETLGSRDTSSLIEYFDFVKLEQALGDKTTLLP